VVFLAADRGVEAVLNISPINPGAASRLAGLVWRRTQGSGAIYTWATLPDALYGNLATSPLFLPMLVNAALRPGAAALALNVELGKPIVAADSSLSSADDLEVETPRHERFVVHAQSGSSPRRFAFTGTTEPGLYSWHLPGKPDPVWWSNVQLPALEATLEYRPAESMAAGPDVVIARSASELLARLDQNAQPQSRWSGPIAVVLLLLCVEALMGSLPKMWKPQLPRIMTGAAPIG